jgi:hypothetical protein
MQIATGVDLWEFPSSETMALIGLAGDYLCKAQKEKEMEKKGKKEREEKKEKVEKDSTAVTTPPLLFPNAKVVMMRKPAQSLYHADVWAKQLSQLASPSSLCVDFGIEGLPDSLDDEDEDGVQPVVVDAIAVLVHKAWTFVKTLNTLNFHRVSSILPSLHVPVLHCVFYTSIRIPDDNIPNTITNSQGNENNSTALVSALESISKPRNSTEAKRADTFLTRHWAPVMVSEARRILRLRCDSVRETQIKSIPAANWMIHLPPIAAHLNEANARIQFEAKLGRHVFKAVEDLPAIEAQEAAIAAVTAELQRMDEAVAKRLENPDAQRDLDVLRASARARPHSLPPHSVYSLPLLPPPAPAPALAPASAPVLAPAPAPTGLVRQKSSRSKSTRKTLDKGTQDKTPKFKLEVVSRTAAKTDPRPLEWVQFNVKDRPKRSQATCPCCKSVVAVC